MDVALKRLGAEAVRVALVGSTFGGDESGRSRVAVQGWLARAHSLSLSLSPSHSHTHTHGSQFLQMPR